MPWKQDETGYKFYHYNQDGELLWFINISGGDKTKVRYGLKHNRQTIWGKSKMFNSSDKAGEFIKHLKENIFKMG